MNEGVTISKVATFVGTTIKAIRHYHKLGLVDEPPRDTSGYRRYGSAEILQLIQVRALAVAGVPLAKVKPLLTGVQNADILTDIERRLTERIEDLTRQRDALRSLSKNNQKLLPDRATALLDRGVKLGFTPEEMMHTQESFVIAKALFPDSFNDYIVHIEHALNDDVFIVLTKQSWEALAWKPDDPRLEALAITMADYLLTNSKLLGILRCFDKHDKRHAIIDRFGVDQTWSRLNILFEDHLRSGGFSFQSNNGGK